ncbi:MAG: hypothetical protein DRN18_00540 [Thermoplasmata archaeon]|nr:MAG: hypothetical protein DRN18_00540 [Thermoplasmata archaeon]
MDVVSIISSIIGATGGASGWTLTWFYWKKFKRRIKVTPLHSWYSKTRKFSIDDDGSYRIVEITEGRKDKNKILMEINLLIVNDGEISISITDAIAMVKYSKDKLPALQYTQAVFEAHPLNVDYTLPFVVKSHEAKKLQLFYEFKNINVDLLERVGFAKFLGWLRGEVPIVIADEREKEKLWDTLPLQTLLLLHVDAEETENIYIPVFPEDHKIEQKLITLDAIQVENIKRKFWSGDKIVKISTWR